MSNTIEKSAAISAVNTVAASTQAQKSASDGSFEKVLAGEMQGTQAAADNSKYYNFLGGPTRVEGTTEYYDYDVTSFIQSSSGGGSFITVCSGGVCRQVPVGNYSTAPGTIFAGGANAFHPSMLETQSAAAAPAVQAASAQTAPAASAPALSNTSGLEASVIVEAVNALVEQIFDSADEQKDDRILV